MPRPLFNRPPPATKRAGWTGHGNGNEGAGCGDDRAMRPALKIADHRGYLARAYTDAGERHLVETALVFQYQDHLGAEIDRRGRRDERAVKIAPVGAIAQDKTHRREIIERPAEKGGGSGRSGRLILKGDAPGNKRTERQGDRAQGARRGRPGSRGRKGRRGRRGSEARQGKRIGMAQVRVVVIAGDLREQQRRRQTHAR